MKRRSAGFQPAPGRINSRWLLLSCLACVCLVLIGLQSRRVENPESRWLTWADRSQAAADRIDDAPEQAYGLIINLMKEVPVSRGAEPLQNAVRALQGGDPITAHDALVQAQQILFSSERWQISDSDGAVSRSLEFLAQQKWSEASDFAREGQVRLLQSPLLLPLRRAAYALRRTQAERAEDPNRAPPPPSLQEARRGLRTFALRCRVAWCMERIDRFTGGESSGQSGHLREVEEVIDAVCNQSQEKYAEVGRRCLEAIRRAASAKDRRLSSTLRSTSARLEKNVVSWE